MVLAVTVTETELAKRAERRVWLSDKACGPSFCEVGERCADLGGVNARELNLCTVVLRLPARRMALYGQC